jgi:uncharacterized protein YjbI with pentapeptide repeats
MTWAGMPDGVEALGALRAGQKDWEAFCSGRAGRIDFRLTSLAGINLSGFRLTDCDFESADLQGVSFDNAVVVGCRFGSVSLSHASFVGTQLLECVFQDVDLDKSKFRNAEIVDCTISESSLGSVRLDHSRLARTSFTQCSAPVTFVFDWCRVSDCVIDELDGNLRMLDTVVEGGAWSQLVLAEWSMARVEIRGVEMRAQFLRSGTPGRMSCSNGID